MSKIGYSFFSLVSLIVLGGVILMQGYLDENVIPNVILRSTTYFTFL